jgi:hypothetical protein
MKYSANSHGLVSTIRLTCCADIAVSWATTHTHGLIYPGALGSRPLLANLQKYDTINFTVR